MKTVIAVIFIIFTLAIGVQASKAVVEPAGPAFFNPLGSFKDRRSYSELKTRFLDGFGAYRNRGHKHAGLDISTGFAKPVYSIAKGKVVGTFYRFPYLAVIVEHSMADGSSIYSSYAHLADVLVKPGQAVDEKTPLARSFNEEEFKSSGFSRHHLHFEIRKTTEDKGRASYSGHSMDELNAYFQNPAVFLKNRLAP